MAETAQTKLVFDDEVQASESKKKMEMRAEIDTSPPFESVKEAVTHFGGSGFWIPLHLLRDPHLNEEFDINKVEEQAAELEKKLFAKEQETLEVLKDLETTKQTIEELKLKLHKEASNSSTATPGFEMTPHGATDLDEKTLKFLGSNPEKIEKYLSLCPSSSLGLILMELKQAKLNLSKTTSDLAVIRASVGKLNRRAERQKSSIDMTHERLVTSSGIGTLEDELKLTTSNQVPDSAEARKGLQIPAIISKELEQLNFEAEQFIKMAEAAKSELLKATSGIEQPKVSLKTAEMKWVAAKKMEEAAKAVEAVALAEMKSLDRKDAPTTVYIEKPEGIPQSFQDHATLTFNSQKFAGQRHSHKKVLDAMIRMDDEDLSKLAILKKLEEATEEVKYSKRALEEAFNRVEVANKQILETEEALKRWGPEHGNATQKLHLGCNSTKNKYMVPSPQRHNKYSQEGHTSQVQDETKHMLRPTISVGDLLHRKQIMPEDLVAIRRMEGRSEGQKISLSQMLHRQRNAPSSPPRCERTSNNSKQFFARSKKFGFIHLSIPLTKQSKTQAAKPKNEWIGD